MSEAPRIVGWGQIVRDFIFTQIPKGTIAQSSTIGKIPIPTAAMRSCGRLTFL
ncbi:MAG: hypothetical protein NT070_23435 [Cyanobacteria bacterium]|nr:hypothetical protein [Cyanobacteriota bacterium]